MDDCHLYAVAVNPVLPDRQLFKGLPNAIFQVLLEQLLHCVANLAATDLLALVAGKLAQQPVCLEWLQLLADESPDRLEIKLGLLWTVCFQLRQFYHACGLPGFDHLFHSSARPAANLLTLQLALDLEWTLDVFDRLQFRFIDQDLQMYDLVEKVRYVKFVAVYL